MAAIIASVKAIVILRMEDGNEHEVGTIEVPITATMTGSSTPEIIPYPPYDH
jgi:hypothetical protein